MLSNHPLETVSEDTILTNHPLQHRRLLHRANSSKRRKRIGRRDLYAPIPNPTPITKSPLTASPGASIPNWMWRCKSPLPPLSPPFPIHPLTISPLPGLEVNFGIAAACIPALYPGYTALSRKITSYRSSRRSSHSKSEKQLLPPPAVPATDGVVLAPPRTAYRPQGVCGEEADGIRRTTEIEVRRSSDLDVELGDPAGQEGRTGTGTGTGW